MSLATSRGMHRTLTLFSLLSASLFVGSGSATAAPSPTLAGYLTSKKVSSAVEAKANAVTTVRDGDPLFIFLEVTGGSLADVAFPISDDPDIVGSDLPWLSFVHGKAGDRETDYEDCTFALTKAEAKKSSIALSLSPGDLRPAGSLDCILKVASANKGTWKNEIRFKNTDHYKNVPALPLTVDVPTGVTKYKAAWASLEKRIDAGSSEFNAPPEAVDINDAGLTSGARVKAAKALGAPLKRFFFTSDSWFEDKNDLGTVVSMNTTAAMTYKLKAACYFEVLQVTKGMNGKAMRVERQGSRYEITCDKL